MAKVKMTGDIQQGVAGISSHYLKLTDDIAAVCRQEKRRAANGERPTHKQRQQMQSEKQTDRCYRRWEKWLLFHGLIIRFLKQGLGTLFVAAILGAPAVSWADGELPWLLVETQALTLTVFSAENKVLDRFDNISIGSGGTAEIRRRGDQTTPLGIFHVAWIDRHNRYDTFFGLDYPSEKIARRAYAEGIISRVEFDAIIKAFKHRRTPPQNTPLGGRLGIHGIGRGDLSIHEDFNWTNGCVALTNLQIRRLSRWVHIGTRVVIR